MGGGLPENFKAFAVIVGKDNVSRTTGGSNIRNAVAIEIRHVGGTARASAGNIDARQFAAILTIEDDDARSNRVSGFRRRLDRRRV